MGDTFRRPRLSGDFCQVPNRVIRMPANGPGERLAKELLIYRLSLPDELDNDFSWYALRYLGVPRNSYYRAMRVLAEWGFVDREDRRVGRHDHTWTLDVRWSRDRPEKLATVPKTGTVGGHCGGSASDQIGHCDSDQIGHCGAPPYPPTDNTKKNTKLHSGRAGVSQAKEDGVFASLAPEGGWAAEAGRYERHYLAETAGLPASKVSGAMSSGDRRRFDALMASGVPVIDLMDVVTGMVREVADGDRFRAENPRAGLWHLLVFRLGNVEKYAPLGRRCRAERGRLDEVFGGGGG